MYIKTDIPKGHSTSLSLNSSRGMSVNSAVSSMDYGDHVQAQVNNITWANGEVQSPSLFYVSRLLTMDLTFIFHFSFYFIWFCFSFIFLFLEQLRLGFISHAVTSVTN